MRIPIISVNTLKDYMGRNDFLLVDLREKEDYEKEHIGNAVFVPWEHAAEEIRRLVPKRAQEIKGIILYCDHGSTSLSVARELLRDGYLVMSLNGGYSAWKRQSGQRG